MIHSIYLGRVDYAEALRLQEELVALRTADRIGNVLLLLEHPPVLTLGRNANRANILASDELLACTWRHAPRHQPRRRRNLPRSRPAHRLPHLRPAQPAQSQRRPPRPGRLRSPDGRGAHPGLRRVRRARRAHLRIDGRVVRASSTAARPEPPSHRTAPKGSPPQGSARSPRSAFTWPAASPRTGSPST